MWNVDLLFPLGYFQSKKTVDKFRLLSGLCLEVYSVFGSATVLCASVFEQK